jgi:hypothetical protein
VLSDTGGFLIIDVALLGIAVWTIADCVRAINRSSPRRRIHGDSHNL